MENSGKDRYPIPFRPRNDDDDKGDDDGCDAGLGGVCYGEEGKGAWSVGGVGVGVRQDSKLFFFMEWNLLVTVELFMCSGMSDIFGY